MSSRSSRRPGVSVNRGSLNPKITVSTTAPLNPKNKDMWFDITASPGTWKYYDTATTAWIA